MIGNWGPPSLLESRDLVHQGNYRPALFLHGRCLEETRSVGRLDLLPGVALVLVVLVSLLEVLLLWGILLLPRVLLLQGATGTFSSPCQVLWRSVLLLLVPLW